MITQVEWYSAAKYVPERESGVFSVTVWVYYADKPGEDTRYFGTGYYNFHSSTWEVYTISERESQSRFVFMWAYPVDIDVETTPLQIKERP